MKLVIPTRLREKIPDGFVYPLWPTKITALLEGTEHRKDSELVFRWRDELQESSWRKRIEERGTVKLVEAAYTPHWSPYFPKWKISLYSVPKYYQVAAHNILLDGEITALIQKLKEHGLTPEDYVKETITMDLSEWRYDGKRRMNFPSDENHEWNIPQHQDHTLRNSL